MENPDCQLHSYCFGIGDEPHDEGAGGWSLYYPTGHPAICGHKGSGAESYANWYNDNAGKYGGHMSFVDITQQELSDTTTGISVATTEQGAKLSIAAVDSGSIGVQLNGEIVSAYDISLKKGGQTIRPTDAVTVRIPCGDADAKVFRKEQDGSLTDMKAVYENGYLVFTTDHFSLYIVALSTEKPRLIGDVDGDGQVTLVDATYIQRKLASMKVPATFSDAAADIDGDNEVSISDATFIMRWIAYIDIPHQVGYETDS